VRPGQEVRVKQSSRELVLVQAAMEQSARGGNLAWIAVDKESYSGRVLEKPARTAIPLAAQEQLVVELYSK
jgi:small subunit ribosomal protein S4